MFEFIQMCCLGERVETEYKSASEITAKPKSACTFKSAIAIIPGIRCRRLNVHNKSIKNMVVFGSIVVKTRLMTLVVRLESVVHHKL